MSDAVRAARDHGLRLLARREHSTWELRRKLGSRGHKREPLDLALARLIADGYLSNARFAESYVRSRTQRGFGPVSIRAGLKKRGIDDVGAELALAAAEVSFRELCEQARARKFGAGAPVDRKQWLRQAQFLSRRGFAEGQVRVVLGAAGRNDE